jgi:hypothetical protein
MDTKKSKSFVFNYLIFVSRACIQLVSTPFFAGGYNWIQGFWPLDTRVKLFVFNKGCIRWGGYKRVDTEVNLLSP